VERKYYEAYDDRYKQVHQANLCWFDSKHSPVLAEIIGNYHICKEHSILEIGCGEGRDAAFLLEGNYNLLATDISPEAIRYCRQALPEKAEHFAILDCLSQNLDQKFDFIYAIAVVHMLVLDTDRTAFYAFIKEHLSANGIALICSMGDGEHEHSSDIRSAFNIQNRLHEGSGTYLNIASTSCRVVSMLNFRNEIENSGLCILESGKTVIEPDFPQMLYAVVKKA
jgi:cyclopropane fatty-acyl-phospholipid synthase-like methyltransferase